MSSPLPPPAALQRNRAWLIFFGLFSLLVGGFCIAAPVVMTIAIEQMLGIVLVASGVFSLVAVLFGDEKNHRISTVVLALIRLVTGLAFLVWVRSGVIALTALLGAFFLAEGVVFVASALALRHHRAWGLVLLNGLVTLVLGGSILAQLTSGEPWAIGLLYGIYSLFYGVSLLGFALASRPAA
jgi:uncharacterized membrane protein HdeD (DUF308 family)